ncbi:hypothetical protein Tco_0618276 [Tanacetum coccineum]
MSSASTVTYTSVYTNSKPGRVFWGADEELSDGGSPRVIVYGYDGLPIQPVAPPSSDYVPGPEHPPSLDYVPGPEHPPSPAEPLPVDASLVALSSGYVADFDLEEDPEEDHADYPADGGDGDDEPSDDNNDTDDEDEEPFEDEDDDEEEEHLALADSIIAPTVDSVPSSEEIEPFETDESAATPPSPPTHYAPALSSSPLPIVPHPYGSPNHVRAPPGFRAAMGRLRASSPSTYHPLHPSPPLPPPPSSLYLPPHVPTSLPLPSSPLPALLFIPPPVDHREDIPEAELPTCKRLCPTAPTLRYEVGESSTASPRPTRGHRIDYGFIGTLDAETRRQRAEEVGYGIRDVWVDPREAVEELAPTTLKGDRQTQLFERVDGLVEDRQFHQETTLLLDQEALASREAWAHSVGLSSAVHFELQAYRTHTQMQDYQIASQESLTTALIAQVSSLQGQLSAALGQIQALQARDQTHADDREGAASTTVGLVFSFLVSDNHNNIPPRKSSATARAAAAARAADAAAATPMTVEDGSHNSDTRIIGTVRTLREYTYKDFLNYKPISFKGTEGVVVLSQWFKKMESVFYISNCAVENQVKFAICTFLGNALIWWNSYMKTVTQDVAYAMD